MRSFIKTEITDNNKGGGGPQVVTAYIFELWKHLQAITEIEQSISDFENSLDPDLIKKIICQFENNRVGNHDKHVIIRDKYFSVAQMNSYLSKIEQVISNIEDRNLRNMLLNEYNRAIVGEQKKVESCKRFRKNGQTSGFDFETTLNRIKAITDVQPDIEK